MSVVPAERKGQVAEPREGRTDFEQTLRSCTVLVLTCPLDETTRGMIGSKELSLMRKDSILINVARGGVVVEDALVKALMEGWIRGAATDVFAIEPADATTSPLITLGNTIPNLTLSPHIAWYASSSIENLQTMVKYNIEGFVAGYPQNVI
jgi:phosphoglycerate dehydrogenase-like enzyme